MWSLATVMNVYERWKKLYNLRSFSFHLFHILFCSHSQWIFVKITLYTRERGGKSRRIIISSSDQSWREEKKLNFSLPKKRKTTHIFVGQSRSSADGTGPGDVSEVIMVKFIFFQIENCFMCHDESCDDSNQKNNNDSSNSMRKKLVILRKFK